MIYKHVILLIALSVAAIFFQTELMRVLQFLMYVHAELAKGLGVIFSLSEVGEVVQSVLALLLIPVVLAIIIGVVHFFVRQHHFSHPMTVIWICWAVLLASVLSQTGRVSDHPTDRCKPVMTQPMQNPKGSVGESGDKSISQNKTHQNNANQNNVNQDNANQDNANQNNINQKI